VEAGAWKRKTYDLRKKEPKEGYAPQEHCKEFGHSFQVVQDTEDHYGIGARVTSQCQVCKETDTYYDD